MHLQSIYRDERILSYRLDQLSPMDIHVDDRYLTRDLPRIKESGLWYPLMLYKVTPEWWHSKFMKWVNKDMVLPPPVTNDDGMIWAVKMGCNRWQCAVHLGYTHIDGIMFDNSDDLVKWGRFFAQCDPLTNKEVKYTGAWEYN